MFVLQTRGFCSRLWRTQRFTREGRRWGGGAGAGNDTLEHGGQRVCSGYRPPEPATATPLGRV